MLAKLTDEDLAIIRGIIEKRALRLEDLDIRAFQTRMSWSLFNEISDDLQIGRDRRPGADRERERARDVSRQRRDRMAPGNDSFRFDNQFSLPSSNSGIVDVDEFLVDRQPSHQEEGQQMVYEGVFCLDRKCIEVIENIFIRLHSNPNIFYRQNNSDKADRQSDRQDNSNQPCRHTCVLHHHLCY